jgi:hypothetical protein
VHMWVYALPSILSRVCGCGAGLRLERFNKITALTSLTLSDIYGIISRHTIYRARAAGALPRMEKPR